MAGLQRVRLDQLVGDAMSQENCGSCQHWHVESGKVAVLCECRRFPPVIVIDGTEFNPPVKRTLFPLTLAVCHCGEHKKAVPT